MKNIQEQSNMNTNSCKILNIFLFSLILQDLTIIVDNYNV